ncbi:propionyl-CoA carboxylase alpha chain [Geodermatophilus normandii]|uniref:Biotin-dependent 3-methylcrotonyl-coenzyme A carboxylase alpha1 subunit n=1 Tax=Geodermatophilus normandii TaxID=1137989 RepID=A0A317QM86_9ACTN|nr:biotin carboxylase N-terminal domain-containing protein [Geodermatophilus normandii]PWW24093.1 propionyl-CoA carboxylase alpha chain [Geodermatophilus normandii]
MTRPLSCVLVANRGEIARRVVVTARAMGLRTVAVYSDADAAAPFVADADVAVRLPGSTPADTYLRADLVVAAALRSGADCVHPGYGFLSENADFARAVEAAGLVFVGPDPGAVEAMGSKLAAKELMARAGVPVLPSVDATGLSGDTLEKAASEVGYPLLVKASFGGGGRGMRTVREPSELGEAVEGAAREAASAFGDGTVFLERLVERPRHVEVQVFGDRSGTTVALFERECSIQRRHQKVVEEAPSPAVGPDLRARLHEAAVAAARAIGYVGAGTVEFLLEESGDFWFLEMNTRLQVEHPVTEAVTGLDLVRLQFDVAAGRPLPAEAVSPTLSGAAIEVRLYAEDPARGWLPQSGRLAEFAIPADTAFRPPPGPGIRVDSGVVAGGEVGVHYDPMLAKVIAWAPDRASAALALAGALARARLHGLTTNRDLLVRVLRHPAFLAGETDTAFLDRHGLDVLAAPLVDDAGRRRHAVVAALAGAALRRAAAPVLAGLPSGWRNNPTAPQTTAFDAGTVRYRLDRSGVTADVDGEPVPLTVLGTEVTGPGRVRLDVEAEGLRSAYKVHVDGDRHHVDGPEGATTLVERPRFPEPTAAVAPGSLTATMPGAVTRVAVAEGDEVRAGQLVLVLEAMKMEHPVVAPTDGVVTSLHATVGAQVETGAVLAVVSEQVPHPETEENSRAS